MKKIAAILLCLFILPQIGWGEEGHLIEFDDIDNAWIDYDYEQNKWVYNGSIEEMQEEIKKIFDDMPIGISLIVLEIIRELKEEKGEEEYIDSPDSRDYPDGINIP